VRRRICFLIACSAVGLDGQTPAQSPAPCPCPLQVWLPDGPVLCDPGASRSTKQSGPVEPTVEELDELNVSPTVIGEDELLEFDLRFFPVVWAMTEQAMQVVEIRLERRNTQLRHAFKVASETYGHPMSVAVESGTGQVVLEASREMSIGRPKWRMNGIRFLHSLELDAHHMGNSLEGKEVGFDDPMEVEHVIGTWYRVSQDRVKFKRIGERPQDVVVLDSSHIDWSTTLVPIAPEQCGDVAERNEGVAGPYATEVHHRIPDVRKLEIQHGHDPSVEVVELARVPDDS
jgi:hypothetical protein